MSALSASSSRNVELSRKRLEAAFASPSGKLTLSAELVIPEPRDATSILLLSNAVQTLSERIRSCKTNAAFVHGSLTALQTFTNEQATALGNFPGPVPAIYCENRRRRPNDAVSDGSVVDADASVPGESVLDTFAAIASAGADGLLVPICGGAELSVMADLVAYNENDGNEAWNNWREICQAALFAGLQPVPEITVGSDTAAAWAPEDLDSWIDTLVGAMGMEPVAVVLTVNPVDNSNANNEDKENTDDSIEQPTISIPILAKATSKRIPILGSVRVTAGDDRLSEVTMRFKDAGFSGTLLRSDCVPGFRSQPNLEITGQFWHACITDLKSTRSKAFSFRAKNKMNVSAATKWGNYQQNVIASGALGDPEESASLNEAAGDYQGFA